MIKNGSEVANGTVLYWSKVLQAPVPAVDGFDTEMYQYLGPQYLNFATRTFEDGRTIGESAVEVILMPACWRSITSRGGCALCASPAWTTT